jgi:peptidoglycan/LPS O-acetylase OafA/YrhL
MMCFKAQSAQGAPKRPKKEVALVTLQSQTLPPPKTSRVSTIEFWRFVFTAMVCIYNLEIFFRQRELLVSGTSAVEFFFVLAGFLIAMSAKRDLAGRTEPVTTKQAHAMALDYVKKKLKAIYPILIVVVLLGFLVYPAAPSTFTERLLSLRNTEWEWLLLVGTPFGFNAAAAPIIPMWFLTALIAAGYIYTFALYKHYDS